VNYDDRAREIALSIIADIEANPMVTTARGVRRNMLDAGSFAELHDYCDANMLGDSEKLMYECGYTREDEEMDDVTRDRLDDEARERFTGILNRAQGIVDLWLRTRKRA
jgi:hypothetical protein